MEIHLKGVQIGADSGANQNTIWSDKQSELPNRKGKKRYFIPK